MKNQISGILLRYPQLKLASAVPDIISVDNSNARYFMTINETCLCQRSGLISIAHGGRLGNQLGEYASLLAASKVINATPVISEVMRKKLVAVFPYFTIPVLKCPKTPIKWTHIGIQKIQHLTTHISKQIMIVHYYIVVHTIHHECFCFSSKYFH